MAITVKHKFVSAIPDAGDPTIVQPSNWNDSHDLVGTVPVANGGTGAATLTGYVIGNGTAAMTASTTIPSTAVTGLGTMSTQNSNNISVTGGSISGTTVSGYIPTTEKAVANGVATLDGGGTVPISQLPAAVLGALSYQGTWNASTNTPTLTSSVGTKGYYYVVNVAGSTNLNGVTDWQVGDWAVYNGTAWQKVDNTDAVTSVNGYTGTVVLGYGDITTGIVPVINGGTGVTTSSGANSVVLRDANGNITTNCLFEGYVSQAASGTTIVLTAATAQNYNITGSGGQIIRLPNATTLPNGATFTFNNNQSSGAITVQNNSSTTIATINSGGYVTVVLLSNSIAAGSWDRHDSTPSNVTWSTNTLDYAGSITSATWNGNTVQVNRGGTGATTLTGYVKGSGTSALTAASTIPTTDLSGTITNAQLANSAITINGTSTSLGGSISVGTVTAVTGTAPVASSGGTTPAISMAKATSIVDGYLSAIDWNTFNNKQPAGSYLTAVTASAPLSGSGTAGSPLVISQSTTSTNGYLSSTDWNTFNNKQPSGTYVNSVAATSPITSTGGVTPTIAIPVATTSVNGYLASTDWNTFNGKQTALVSGTNIKTVNGTSLLGSGDVPVGVLTVTGTAPVVSSGGANPAISMPAATTAVSGYLTNTDWNIFNGKGTGTVTSVTATSPVTSTGGTTPVIAMPAATTSVNGYLTSADWTTFNGKGSGTVTSVAALTLGTTGTDLSSTVATGTTTPVITLQVPTASATNRGALSSTDWTTFNNKAASFTYTSTYIPYGQGTTTPNQASNFTFDGTTQSAPIQRASNGIVVNSKTVSASYSIASGDNAMSAGPITVASGQSVTIASGSRWVVL